MPSTQTPALVLDGSVALAWCFVDEADSYADVIARRVPGMDIVVPALWHLEVANALLTGERRRRCTPVDTARWLSSLRSLPIIVDDTGVSHAWGDLLSLARAHGLSAYDAAYLELALRRGLPLATLDRRLQKAARAAHLELYAA